MLVARHPGIAQRAQEDGVVVPGQGGELLLGDRGPIPQVAVGAQVPLHQLQLQALGGGHRLQDPPGFPHHLPTDAVSWYEGDA